MKIKESLNMTFDESLPSSKTSPLVDDDLDEDEAVKVVEKKVLDNDIKDETLEVDEIANIKESKNHPLGNELVPHLKSTTIIGTKWMYRNKLDENGAISHFKLFHMDVKSAFLNGIINEEVYVAQPSSRVAIK
nr:hypothetical protein [Tanacetum cinerariifolium]